MSVRRLSRVQPPSFAFSEATQAEIAFWFGKFPEHRRQSAMIPILWLVQKQEGWVSEPAIRAVAELLGTPVIRVLEVATFYTMFQLEPVGRVLIQVCGTTPCALRGAGEIMEVCKSKIGPKNHLSADGMFTWQEVECLGACVNAPMAQINDYYFEDLTPASMTKIIDDFAAGGDPQPGNYVERKNSAPVGEQITLTDPTLFDGSRAQRVELPNRPQPEPVA
ncbi:MAG TPA: NADH-quinone oxidoreductase subunit NuoE [Lautropia sp.]|nr:NADH-quinone oxidoreductase subunit NuoE [Lautropia sp.]